MKIQEAITTIDNWLRRYDEANNLQVTQEPGSMQDIRQYVNELSKLSEEQKKNTDLKQFTSIYPLSRMPRIERIERIVLGLAESELLTSDNLDAVMAKGTSDLHHNLHLIFSESGKIKLTQENLNILLDPNTQPTALRDLSHCIGIFFDAHRAHRDAHGLTQERFNSLLFCCTSIWNQTEIKSCLNRLPPHLLGTVVLDRLITVSRNNVGNLENTIGAINDVIDRALRIIGHGEDPQGVNRAQSTHTASVHKSVSESAKKLADRYGKDMDTNAVIDGWIKTQSADEYVVIVDSSVADKPAEERKYRLAYEGYSLRLQSVKEAMPPSEVVNSLKDKTVLLQRDGEGKIFAYWRAEDGYARRKELENVSPELKDTLRFPDVGENPVEIFIKSQCQPSPENQHKISRRS